MGGVGAVDVDGEDGLGGGVGGEARGEFLDEGPDDLAVGAGDVEAGDLGGVDPFEGAFADGMGREAEGADDLEAEHEPVAGVFSGVAVVVGAFGDDAEEADVVEGEGDVDFFMYFAEGAGVGGFAGGLFEFAADGGVEVLVGVIGAAEEEEVAGVVEDVDEDGDFVGEEREHRRVENP